MMFKVISMHSKPCKHAKYNEILRNTWENSFSSKHLGVLTVCPKNICAPKLIICMIFVRCPGLKKQSKPPN